MKMNKLALAACSLAIMLMCVSCGEMNPGDVAIIEDEVISEDINDHTNTEMYTGNSYGRAMKYLELLNEDELNNNLVFSPASLDMVLSMVANGMTDEAKSSIEEFMGDSVDNVNDYYSEILHDIETETEYDYSNTEINMANAFLVKEGAVVDDNISSEFKNIVEDMYMAKVDTYKPGDSDKINKWVSDNTSGRIKELLGEEVIEQSKGILINTLFFSDSWEDSFEEGLTKKHKFKTPTGEVMCDMMSKVEDSGIGYLNNNDAEGVVLDYSGGYEFIAFKLKNGKSISEIDIDALLDSESYSCDINLKLPKFKIESDWDLRNLLADVGLHDILKPDALNNIMEEVKTDLGIDKVIQKANIELDEDGTVAVAATYMSMTDGAAFMDEQPKVIDVVFDEPFVYMIRDRHNDLPMFIGSVSDPTK